MIIYDAKINHLTNPIGYFMDRAVFSWKVKEAEGKKQKAARIVVSYDMQGKNIVFDSDWDENADSLAYTAEIDLQPRTGYFWNVSVISDSEETAVSEQQYFETGKMQESWTGSWISCDMTDSRHPYFSKEIIPSKELRQARLYITGLGLYEAYIDGKKVGNEYLTPYSNNYSEWVQYQTYDVTEFLEQGGKLSVLLGNGWYKGRFGFEAGGRENIFGDEFKLIADIVLTYTDGTEEVIGTDETWEVTRSNITFSNIYDGEQMDDTLPAAEPEAAHVTEAPKGTLEARRSLPVTAHEEFVPKEVIHTPAGETVLDIGQEIAGLFTLRVHEPAGSVIHIQTGEVLQNGNFYNENLRTAKSEYIYVSNGVETVIAPRFTYYGFRYVKISGVTHLDPKDFKAFAIYSDIQMCGDIETGHDLVNQLVSNVRWGMKSNFVDVPTDCPQRDERMGWTGDTQVFSPTATYFADTYAFYGKYMYDCATEQRTKNGMVPMVIPSCGMNKCSSVWGDAACIVPWNMYKFYGDKKILEDQFDSMKDWVDYMTSVDGDDHGWRKQFSFGDWLALDNPSGKADEFMGGTDTDYISAIYYAASAEIVAKAAKVLGKQDLADAYKKLSEKLFAAVREEYFTSTGRCAVKTQTGLILALKYHLSSDEEKTRAMLKRSIDDRGGKLATGFTGLPLMNPVLSDNGMEDIAFRMLLNEEYPGWLYEIKTGATTVWERWNSLDGNGNISSTGMNSLNHYSYGAVVEWMFAYAAGFRVDEEHPGSKYMRIAPSYNWKLRQFKSTYDSAAGEYESAWKIIDPNHVKVSVTVPFDCEADIVLPYLKESGYDAENPLFADTENGICHVGAGTYEVTYETAEALRTVYSTNMPIEALLSAPEVTKALESIGMGLRQVPGRFKKMSLREMVSGYAKNMPEEKLDELDRFLASIE